MTVVIVLMGVSGSGKTTVGEALAQKLGVPFYDGDDFHPPENVAKMTTGTPLDDDDRHPWLARLHDLIADHLEKGEMAVFACSALKKKYREQLRHGNDGLRFVHLQGAPNLIWERMQGREAHYMSAAMLQTQIEALETPSAEDTLIVNVKDDVDTIVLRVVQSLGNS